MSSSSDSDVSSEIDVDGSRDCTLDICSAEPNGKLSPTRQYEMIINNKILQQSFDATGRKVITISSEYQVSNDNEQLTDSKLVDILKEIFKVEMLENGNPRMFLVSQEVIKLLEDRLSTFVLSGRSCQEEESESELLVELFRSLRNCSSNGPIQNFISDETRILSFVENVFQIVDKKHSCIRIMLQFLVNLTSSNKAVTAKINELFGQVFKKFIQEHVCIYESSALLYNISLSQPIEDQETIKKLLDLYSSEQHQNEFLCFFLENSVSSDILWRNYTHFKVENRLKILEILKEMQITNKLQKLSDVGLEILIKKFLTCGEIFFQMDRKNAQEAYEVSLVLEILSSLSSNEAYLEKLQTHKDILVNSGALLINIHRLGKMSNNEFTPIQKLSEDEMEGQKLNEHPAFGFKADLVRLIGNICWKNSGLQNLARTAEVIPIILDSCNIDARNPFITQWSILAIRNLCENNAENQKVIAGLHQQGTVSSDVLEEMGITVHSDGDRQLKIVSLESLRR
ncbi:hypothetical protein JTB14_033196 [Gonioctena quinquepunctata]|nr:hypothetical protein JTB14_033196 [Gonioctena quinquepunctata]